MNKWLPSLDWLKHLSKQLDGKGSFGAVLAGAMVMIVLFGGNGGMVVGVLLLIPLIIITITYWEETRRAMKESRPKLSRPKIVVNNHQSRSGQPESLPAHAERSEMTTKHGEQSHGTSVQRTPRSHHAL